jgi:hypothetical protein
MAQTKARASTKRARPKKSQARSEPKKTQARSKGSAGKSRTSSGNRGSNGREGVNAARQAVASTTKETSLRVGRAASRARTPLLAGGAALAGAAGGLAVGSMQSRRKVLGVKMPQPKRVRIRSRDMARAAREVGTFGQHLGELATEMRQAREGSGNGNKHRSPVEVVLDGLTARR